MTAQVKCAFFIVWLVLSVIACSILAAPFLLPHDVIYNLTPECEWKVKHGISCFLCGMTQSFILISSGRFSEAMVVNQHSLFLYAAFLFSSTLFLLNGFKWLIFNHSRKYIKTLLIR